MWLALSVVMMNKEFDGSFMHGVDLGKGQGASHQASQSLAQRVVEAFDVISLASSFTGIMLLWWQHRVIGFPKVAVAQAAFVAVGNALPEQAAGLDAART